MSQVLGMRIQHFSLFSKQNDLPKCQSPLPSSFSSHCYYTDSLLPINMAGLRISSLCTISFATLQFQRGSRDPPIVLWHTHPYIFQEGTLGYRLQDAKYPGSTRAHIPALKFFPNKVLSHFGYHCFLALIRGWVSFLVSLSSCFS